MKNSAILCWMFVAQLAASAVLATPVTINQTREEEPNNTLAQANQLNDNSGILQCMFDSPTDDDLYKFTTDVPNQILTVEAVGNFPTDTYLVILDHTGLPLAEDDDSGAGTNAKITGLTLGPVDTYYIWVYEITGGSGAGYTYSLTGQIADPADTQAPTYPGAPGIISATRTNPTSVALTWHQAQDNQTPTGQIQYRIYYDTVEANVFTAGPKTTITGATTTTVTGLNDSQTYYFGVRAVDQVGNAETNTVTVSAPPLTAVMPAVWTLYE